MRAEDFPTTIWSRLKRAGAGRATDLRLVVEDYRPVVVRCLRDRGVADADAEDVAQEVFRTLLKDGLLERADRARGRFRALLRWLTDNAWRKWRRKERGPVRGGHVELPPEEVLAGRTPVGSFEEEWWKEVAWIAARRLRKECERTRSHACDMLMDRLMDEMPFDEIGRRWNVSAGTAQKTVERAGKRLRALTAEVIREYCSSRAEYADELKMLEAFQKGRRGARPR